MEGLLFRRTLVREVRRWVEEGLIDAGRGEAILARYGRSLDESPGSLGYALMLGLGILSLGLALLLVVSHNWEDIPRAVRMGALMLVTAGLNLQGLLCIRAGRPNTGIRWLFAGGLAYGASIMLIAQIYHLGEHFPDGLFWWALGVMPLALLTRSRLLHLLQLSLATLWLVAEGHYALPLSYPVFAAAAVVQLWRGAPSRVLALLAVLGMAVWLMMAYGQSIGATSLYRFRPGHLAVLAGFALVLYALGQRLATSPASWWRAYGETLNLWLMRLALVVLLGLSFESAWHEMLEHLREDITWLWFLLAADVLVVLVARGVSLPRRISLGFAALLANGLLLCGWLLPDGEPQALGLALAVNLFLLLAGIRLILRGLALHEAPLFHTGVALILVLAAMRYLDLIGSYLGGATLFLVGGAVFFGAARFWRHRTGGEGA